MFLTFEGISVIFVTFLLMTELFSIFDCSTFVSSDTILL